MTTPCEEALNCGLPLSLLHHLCNSKEGRHNLEWKQPKRRRVTLMSPTGGDACACSPRSELLDAFGSESRRRDGEAPGGVLPERLGR